MNIAISHKALYRSIIDCTSRPVSELDGGDLSAQRNVAVFSIGRQAVFCLNHVQPKPKNQLLYKPFFRQMILFIHFKEFLSSYTLIIA